MRQHRRLLRLQVDVLVIDSVRAGLAAKRATNTLPIVLATAGDPVSIGLVESLARPGGNITGMSIMHAELGAKRLEMPAPYRHRSGRTFPTTRSLRTWSPSRRVWRCC